MKPMWRDVYPVLASYVSAPWDLEDESPSDPEDYRRWAEDQAPNFRQNPGELLATIDYILGHPEFSLTSFLQAERGVFSEDQLRRIVAIAREVVFTDAPPAPVADAVTMDPSGLLDRTPGRPLG